MASRVEMQIARDYLKSLGKEFDEEGISIDQKYLRLKHLRVFSNTTVICLNCMSIRHRNREPCCEMAPKYDFITSFRVIMNYLQMKGEIKKK